MSSRQRVLDFVACIPRGQVSTYGAIALMSGTSPRYVARVLAGLDEDTPYPWHRVVNAQGKVSVHPNAGGSQLQYLRLVQEGVHFGAGHRIDLATFGARLSLECDYES